MKIVKVKKLKVRNKINSPVHVGDAGFDVFATERVIIEPSERFKMPLGIALEMPEGYYARVETKSGRFDKEGLAVHAGIIDNGYRGEIHAQLLNTNGFLDIEITAGEKVAQVIFQKYYTPKIKYVDKINKTSRGKKGFGSSGKK